MRYFITLFRYGGHQARVDRVEQTYKSKDAVRDALSIFVPSDSTVDDCTFFSRDEIDLSLIFQKKFGWIKCDYISSPEIYISNQ